MQPAAPVLPTVDDLGRRLRFVQPDYPPMHPKALPLHLVDLRTDFQHLLPEIRTAVRELREAMGLSQTALARDVSLIGASLDGTAITRIEKGQRGIRIEELWAIAAVLQVDLRTLIPRDPSMWSRGDQIHAARQRAEDMTLLANRYAAELEAAQQRLRYLEETAESKQRRPQEGQADS